MFYNFTYAHQVQPRTGQPVNVYPAGINCEVREWTAEDAARFPQAAQHLMQGESLVVSTEDDMVLAVPSDEL